MAETEGSCDSCKISFGLALDKCSAPHSRNQEQRECCYCARERESITADSYDRTACAACRTREVMKGKRAEAAARREANRESLNAILVDTLLPLLFLITFCFFVHWVMLTFLDTDIGKVCTLTSGRPRKNLYCNFMRANDGAGAGTFLFTLMGTVVYWWHSSI